MADEFGQDVWKHDADAAHAEAVRRIYSAAEAGKTRLDFRDLSELRSIPEQIEILPGLKELWCGEDKYEGAPDVFVYGYMLTDISALSGLTDLTHVGLSGTRCENLDALASSQGLTFLGLDEVNVKDPSWISQFTQLEKLLLWRADLPSLAFLEPLTQLKALSIGGAIFAPTSGTSRSEADANVMASLSKMQALTLEGEGFPHFDFLTEMPDLMHLFVSRSAFVSLRPLTNASKMTQLMCDRTHLASLDGIGALTQLDSLDIERTSVDDLAPLLDLPIFAEERADRLSYRRTPAADPERDRRLHMLSLLDPKRCAVETIQYLKGTHPEFQDTKGGKGGLPTYFLTNQIARAGEIGLVSRDDQLVAANAGQPEKRAPRQLVQRIEALRTHVATLISMAQQRQVSPEILGLFQSYATALEMDEPTYVMLDGPMAFLRGGVGDSYVTEALDGTIVGGWQQLVTFHDELRPFLLPPDEDILPELSEEATPDAALDLTDETIAALDDPSVDESVRDALTAVKDYFEVAKQDEQRKPGLLRRGIKNLGGVVGQIMIGGAGGALGGWAMTPEAIKAIERLRPIWEALQRFFVGG